MAFAHSGCRLIVQNLRTPCSSPHKCSSVFSVLPNQTSSNQFTLYLPRSSLVPGTRAQTTSAKNASPPSAAVVPKHLKRGPTVGSHVRPAKDPTPMSYHPANKGVIRLQSSSNSRLSRVLHCAQHLSQCPVCSFLGSQGRVTCHQRTLHQSSLMASRLHFTENEGQASLHD